MKVFRDEYGRLRLGKSFVYEDENGYLRFEDSNIPVHRWAAGIKLGRRLRPGEVVHHKDRDKMNNDPQNLDVFVNQDEHDEEHRAAGEYVQERYFATKWEP